MISLREIRGGYLSKDNCKCLKGLMACAIFLCHFRGRVSFLNGTLLGSILTAFGYLFVGFFLFLSGYGLRESFSSKKEYGDSFLKHRLIPFYLDCVLIVILYLPLSFALGKEITARGIFQSLVWGNSYVINGWYLHVAVLIYIAFWIAYLVNKKLNAVSMGAVLIALLICYLVFCILTNASETRLESISGVALGYIWSWEKDKINMAFKIRYVYVLVSSALLFGITTILGNWYFSGVCQTVVKNLSVVFFVIFGLCLLYYLPIQCGVTRFLGEISLEVYVLHGFFIELVCPVSITTATESCIYLSIAFLVSIASAVVLHQVIKWVNALISKTLLKIQPSIQEVEL